MSVGRRSSLMIIFKLLRSLRFARHFLCVCGMREHVTSACFFSPPAIFALGGGLAQLSAGSDSLGLLCLSLCLSPQMFVQISIPPKKNKDRKKKKINQAKNILLRQSDFEGLLGSSRLMLKRFDFLCYGLPLSLTLSFPP